MGFTANFFHGVEFFPVELLRRVPFLSISGQYLHLALEHGSLPVFRSRSNAFVGSFADTRRSQRFLFLLCPNTTLWLCISLVELDRSRRSQFFLIASLMRLPFKAAHILDIIKVKNVPFVRQKKGKESTFSDN